MARLLVNQITSILENTNRSTEIDGAIKEEERARFHTEVMLTPFSVGSRAYTQYIDWVSKLIDKNKLEIFKHL